MRKTGAARRGGQRSTSASGTSQAHCQEHGTEFSDLLNGVRIAKTKELLADPALKVWEVERRGGSLRM